MAQLCPLKRSFINAGKKNVPSDILAMNYDRSTSLKHHTKRRTINNSRKQIFPDTSLFFNFTEVALYNDKEKLGMNFMKYLHFNVI